jgi:hypothetical protein
VICAKCTNRENSKKSVSAVCSFIALKWAGSTIDVAHAANKMIIVHVSQQSRDLSRCRCDSIDKRALLLPFWTLEVSVLHCSSRDASEVSSPRIPLLLRKR